MSHDSRSIPVEGNGYWSWPKRGSQEGRVGWPGRAAYSCDLQLRKVITSSYELVFGCYWTI